MRNEKILKRDDGSKIKIECTLYNYNSTYEFEVYSCEPKKRVWHNVHSNDDLIWRRLDIKAKDVYRQNKQLEFVTKEELLSCALETWGKLKPTIATLF